MDILLAAGIEKYINDKIKTGLYNNASEVIQDALRFMASHEELINLMAVDLKKKNKLNQNHAATSSTTEIKYKDLPAKDYLTAQWIAFFDALGGNVKTTNHTYKNPGVQFSPDFYIEEHRCEFVISSSHNEEIAHELYYELSKTSHKELIVIEGKPIKDCYKAYLYIPDARGDRDFYEETIYGEPHQFGTARRSTKLEICAYRDALGSRINHINLAKNITDDGERPALDDTLELEEAYRIANETIFP